MSCAVGPEVREASSRTGHHPLHEARMEAPSWPRTLGSARGARRGRQEPSGLSVHGAQAQSPRSARDERSTRSADSGTSRALRLVQLLRLQLVR